MSRRRLLVGLVVVALCLTGLAYVGAGIFDPVTEAPPEDADPVDRKIVQPVDNGTHLWPYTSKTQSTEYRTLAINVILYGEPAEVRSALTDRSDLGFEELAADEQAAENDTYHVEVSDAEIDWKEAQGSTRYSYIRSGDGHEWMDESYQLHEGAYLGQRHHIRAYEDPEGEYTAIQIHEEHFDFFQLRHNVNDIDDSAVMLEDEFLDEPFVEQVGREYYGTRGRWSDGWATTIHLGTLFPIPALLGLVVVGTVASPSTRRAIRSLVTNLVRWARENWAGFALGVALIVLVTGTRTVGVALEEVVNISPQLIAGAVYPMLSVGPPLAVLLLARWLEPMPAFGFGVFGLGAAFTLDTIWVGLSVFPVQLLLHRFGLMLALGIIALGVARQGTADPESIDHERAVLVVTGLGAWIAGLAMPLLGMV